MAAFSNTLAELLPVAVKLIVVVIGDVVTAADVRDVVKGAISTDIETTPSGA